MAERQRRSKTISRRAKNTERKFRLYIALCIRVSKQSFIRKDPPNVKTARRMAPAIDAQLDVWR